MSDPARRQARFGPGQREADERRREMADYLVGQRLVRRGPGEQFASDTAKAEDMLDRLTTSQLTLLELEMHSKRPAGHESEYDPFAR